MINSINRLEHALNEYKPARGAWNKGVKKYAEDLVGTYRDRAEYEGREAVTTAEFKEWILNGAKDWAQFSYGGSALIYDYDIAERLCNPTELTRTKGGFNNPNKRETWLDVQARALYQAAAILCQIFESTRACDDEGQPVPLF